MSKITKQGVEIKRTDGQGGGALGTPLKGPCLSNATHEIYPEEIT